MRLPAISMFEELLKIAAKVPVFHANAQKLKLLAPPKGARTSKSDPNAAVLYVGMKNRRLRPHVTHFGKQQTDRFGGDTVHLYKTKADTKKGWRPRLTEHAKKEGYTVEDIHALAEELDVPGSTRQSRAPIWKKLHRLTGTWMNVKDPGATLKAGKVKSIPVSELSKSKG